MDKQMTLSAFSDELAQVRTKKKEFLNQIERIVPCVDFAATSPTARGKKSTFMGNEVHSRGHEVHREQRGFCPSAP